MSLKLLFGKVQSLGMVFSAMPQKFLNWILAAGEWDDTSQWIDDEEWQDGE
jgi:hypothetical protein